MKHQLGSWHQSQDQGVTEAVRVYVKMNDAHHIAVETDRFGYCQLKGASEIEEAAIWGMSAMISLMSPGGNYKDKDLEQLQRLIKGNLNAIEPSLGPYEEKEKCSECGGSGRLTRLGGDWGKTPETRVPCWKCQPKEA